MLLTGNYKKDKKILKILAASWPDLTIRQFLKHKSKEKIKRKKISFLKMA